MNIYHVDVYNYLEVICMKLNRVKEVLNNKEKVDIYYDDRPVWIQSTGDYMAKIGFIDNFEEKDVFIEDLYE
jgi:H-type small acid-soluble spore protein